MGPKNLTCLPGFVASVGLLLTPDFGIIEPTLEDDSVVAIALFRFVCMTVLGKHGVPQELELSPTVLTWVFIATIGLLLTADVGRIEATLEHNSHVVTPSFQTEGITLLGKNAAPQELGLSTTVLTLVFVAMVGLLLTADFKKI